MYTQGEWSNASTYARLTNYANIIVWVKDGQIKHTAQTNKTTEHQLRSRISEMASDYNYRNRLYYAKAHVITKDTWNDAVNMIKNNQNPGSIAELAKKALSVSELKEKNVFIVWNKTTANFVKAVETAEEAEKIAREFATKNTNQAFLVLKPDTIAYQPVSIVVESVKL